MKDVFDYRNSWLDSDAPPLVDEGDRLIRLKEVQRMVGLGATSIYRYVRRGIFPPPVKPTPQISLWSYQQIQQWIRDKLEELKK